LGGRSPRVRLGYVRCAGFAKNGIHYLGGEKKKRKKVVSSGDRGDEKIEGDAETGRPSEKRRREKQNKSLTTNQFAE
jgi:hypothetical protein